MPPLSNLIKSLVVSIGDPKEPIKLILSDLWDSVFSSADVEELLIDALYYALIEEAQGSDMPWTKDKLKDILRYKVDLKNINFEDLNFEGQESSFTENLYKAFQDVALIPDKINSPIDFNNVANRVVIRFKAKFINDVCKEENSTTFRKMVAKYAIDQGIKEQEVLSVLTNYFPIINERTEDIHRMTKTVQEEVIAIKEDVKKIIEAIENYPLLTKESTQEPVYLEAV